MRRSLASPNLRVWQHPGKALRFLVGRRGRSDVLLLGGAWEPGDGGHPARDPRALIATAQRTVKAAVGVDLSLCTQWCAPPGFSTLLVDIMPIQSVSVQLHQCAQVPAGAQMLAGSASPYPVP